VASAKKTGSGGGSKNNFDRPRIRSSHGGAPKTSKTTKPKPRGAKPSKPVAGRPTPRALSGAPSQSLKPKRSGAATPSQSLATDEARELAVAIAIAALDKKAVGLEVLDVAGKVDYADFLVLMSGRSDRQVVALSQAIEETLRKKGRRALSVEGLPHASWVLMDFGDVVVHVFQDDARHLYDIEGLWVDARRIPVPAPAEA